MSHVDNIFTHFMPSSLTRISEVARSSQQQVVGTNLTDWTIWSLYLAHRLLEGNWRNVLLPSDGQALSNALEKYFSKVSDGKIHCYPYEILQFKHFRPTHVFHPMEALPLGNFETKVKLLCSLPLRLQNNQLRILRYFQRTFLWFSH